MVFTILIQSTRKKRQGYFYTDRVMFFLTRARLENEHAFILNGVMQSLQLVCTAIYIQKLQSAKFEVLYIVVRSSPKKVQAETFLETSSDRR